MSLITDQVFFDALAASSEIQTATGGRIYNTSIPVPDEQLKDEPLPYIIIIFDGLVNEGLTKDCGYEGQSDKVDIEILIVAESREDVGKLAETVRKQVQDYFLLNEENELVPLDYNFTASRLVYDPDIPSYSQSLAYECDTNP